MVHELEKWSYGLSVPERVLRQSASRNRLDPHGSHGASVAQRRHADHEVAHGRATDLDPGDAG